MTLDDLFDEFEDILYRFALRLTQDQFRADDLVQETFFRAMAHLGLFEMLNKHQVRAWLSRTLKNIFLDEERSTNRQLKLINDLMETSKSDNDLEIITEYADLSGLIPEELHSIFRMRYEYKMNSREISEVLNIPQGTVRSRLFHGLRKIRAQYTSDQQR